MDKVKTTKGIPLCPDCLKPTRRVCGGLPHGTPLFDEDGSVIETPGGSTITQKWRCLRCYLWYEVMGNGIDGFEYVFDEGANKRWLRSYREGKGE